VPTAGDGGGSLLLGEGRLLRIEEEMEEGKLTSSVLEKAWSKPANTGEYRADNGRSPSAIRMDLTSFDDGSRGNDWIRRS